MPHKCEFEIERKPQTEEELAATCDRIYQGLLRNGVSHAVAVFHVANDLAIYRLERRVEALEKKRKRSHAA